MTSGQMATIVDAAVEAIRSRTDLTKFFLRNAATRHGVPWDETKPGDTKITLEVVNATDNSSNKEGSQTTTPKGNTVEKVTSAVQKVEKVGSWAKTMAPWLLAATGGLGGLAGYWLGRPTTPISTSPPAPTTVIKEGERSLLQYLEDQGRHLPKK